MHANFVEVSMSPSLPVLILFICALTQSCGTQPPPPPRGPDAPPLEGRDAIIPGEIVEIQTIADERFRATVLSVNDEGFEISWKESTADSSRSHPDAERRIYSFEEIAQVRTVSEGHKAGGPSKGTALAVGFGVLLLGMMWIAAHTQWGFGWGG